MVQQMAFGPMPLEIVPSSGQQTCSSQAGQYNSSRYSQLAFRSSGQRRAARRIDPWSAWIRRARRLRPTPAWCPLPIPISSRSGTFRVLVNRAPSECASRWCSSFSGGNPNDEPASVGFANINLIEFIGDDEPAIGVVLRLCSRHYWDLWAPKSSWNFRSDSSRLVRARRCYSSSTRRHAPTEPGYVGRKQARSWGSYGLVQTQQGFWRHGETRVPS